MTTTETAQRRLIEALAALDRTAGSLEGFLLAFPVAIEMAEQLNSPELADVWRRVVDLARAVQADQKEGSHG
jgi:ABC-type phosphate/phosphonate transport system permease subunit